MPKSFSLIRIVALMVIVVYGARMLGKENATEIGRFIASLTLYSAGVLLILWSVLQGKQKKEPQSKNDSENK